LFLDREVLKQDLGISINAVRAKRSRYVPTVLTPEEALKIIGNLSGVYQLVVKLLYGSGLQLTIDFGRRGAREKDLFQELRKMV
jgi:hypothetical protein